jgi:hypothetical protein
MNEKVLFGPKFGTLIHRKGLQFSELLHQVRRNTTRLPHLNFKILAKPFC